MSGINYSKWDNIDLSDDEEGMHPNIDKSLMIRIRREQRAKRNEEEAAERKRLEALGTPEAKKKLEELERNRKWSADDMCTVVSERTIINRSDDERKKQKEQEEAALATMTEDQQAEVKFQKVFEKEDELTEYAKIDDLIDCESWLRQRNQLLNEDSCNWMLLHMLALEMDGKTSAMELATRNYLMMRNILDLAATAKQQPGQVIMPFFMQIRQPEKTAELVKESKEFAKKIKARAIEKKKEEAAAAQEAHDSELS
mmetsp:Transcript_79367/g.140049  ORF Transcript_79367/g.140049 Transcript_79367/m.140049 type:complete len:256 (-) Transcript_79367:769-1536(-)